MPNKTIHTAQDVEDLVRGLTLLGTGGGGHPAVGHKYLMPHAEAGRPMSWTDLSDLPDDAWTCCVFGMGSVAPQEPVSAEERRRMGYVEDEVLYPMLEAVKQLESHAGVRVDALIPFEPGAVATTGPLDAATRLGIHLVDADYCGRAVPELTQTLSTLAGKHLWPAAICDSWGNQLILTNAPSAEVAEMLGKMISIVTKRADPLAVCAHAGFLLPAREAKELVVPGTLSLALTAGAAIREARTAHQDPVAAVANVLDGWLLFTGTVSRRDWENRDGYLFGTTHIEGSGDFDGHTLQVWVQNENHIAWLDDEPQATSPDRLMIVNRETGEPYVNTVLADGEPVAVIGAKADSRYRTASGLEALGPGHFGFDIAYRPIEAVVG